MKILTLPLFTTLVACGSITPTEGVWQATNFDLSQDACNFAGVNSITDESTVLNFTYASTDDGFTLTGDGDDATPIACTLTDLDFDCPLTTVLDFNDEIFGLPAFDAVTTFEGSLSGTFSDANTASATTAVDGVCEGDACVGVLEAINTQFETALEMPCSSTITAEFTAQSE